MAETVLGLTVKVTIKGTVLGTDGARLVVDHVYNQNFSDGTGTNQIGAVWQDLTRNLSTTTEDLQLDGLADFQGDTMSSNNNVKLYYLRNLDDDTGDRFDVGGSAGGNAWDTMLYDATDKVSVGPGGILLCVSPVDGFGITAGDDLAITSSDNSNYRTIIGFDNS